MGSMMNLIDGFSVSIFLVLMYLLSKIIIEKNAQSISMAKILGYTNGEISRLYIMSTSIVVVLFILISLPLELEIMQILFRDYSFFTAPRFLEMIFKIVSEKTIIGKIYHDFSMISKREKWIYFADNAMIIQLQ